MPDLAHGAVGQQDLHDVEAKFHLGIFQQLQIIQRRLRQQAPLACVHRRRRSRPILGRTGFNLGEDKAVIIAKIKSISPCAERKFAARNFRPACCKYFFAARSPSSPRRKCSGFAAPANFAFRFSKKLMQNIQPRMDTDDGARVCDPQQFENGNCCRVAAAHRAALHALFYIRVHPCPSVVKKV